MNQVEFLATEEQREVGGKDERLSWQDRHRVEEVCEEVEVRDCANGANRIDETFQPGGAGKSTERGVRTRSHDLISF